MVDFSKMPCVYWSDCAKISYLQRRIIVYSIMYYELNESCISDREYDLLSKQLVELQKSTSEEEFKKSMYYYAMYDFDGSTGFDLAGKRLNDEDRKYLTNLAYSIKRNRATK